jgi:filamentous hemagglutinin family protein
VTRIPVLALALALAQAGAAQVVLDGSVGPPGELLPDAAGAIEIPEAVGSRAGENLLHSFSQLDIARGQSAAFTARDAGIARVLARVTGGSPSQIDGALRSSIPGADLYLFNPSGVLFGEGATLDLGGSLHVSTADALRLADGTVLPADPAPASLLTRAPPEAWAFTGPGAGQIRIEGSRLEVDANRTLSLVGGPIDIRGRTGARFGEPVLVAPGGRIALAATASAGTVLLGPEAPDVSGIELLDDVTLSGNAQLTTAGPRSGSVAIRARDVDIDNAFVFSDSTGAQAPLARAIDIEARGEVILRGPAELVAELDGSADTGTLHISARSLRMVGRDTVINSWVSEGSGRGGDIELDVAELVLRDGAQIRIESNSPAGRAGHLVVDAGRIDLAGFDTYVGAENRARDGQRGGSFADGIPVRIRAQQITLADGGQILSVTRSAGDGADIEVDAGTLRIAGIAAEPGRLQPAGIVANEEAPRDEVPGRTWSVGDVGSLSVRAREGIEITGGGVIQASSRVREPPRDGRDAGTLRIDAPRIVLRGSAGEAALQSGISTIASLRDAGGVEIASDDLQVLDGASISATTEGPGKGGAVSIRSEHIRVSGVDPRDSGAGIFAQSLIARDPLAGTDGGPAGEIELSVRDLVVSEGGAIRVTTRTRGEGGRLRINASPQWAGVASVRLSNGELTSEALPRAPGEARGGDIEIHARDLVIEGGSRISALNRARGDAGDVAIELEDALRISAGRITTEAARGAGGNIAITARRLVDLLDSEISTSVSGAIGDGGNIRIDPDLVVLNRSSILARASGGNGGDITLVADELLRSADSAIDASSELGVDGHVVIESPVEDLVEEVAPVQADLLGARDLLRRSCAAQSGPSGTLVVAGPRVVRIGPDGVLGDPPASPGQDCEAR